MKLVINKCWGGFSISKEAAQFMAGRGHKLAAAELAKGGEWYGFGYVDGVEGPYKRNDPDLVAAVEELGEVANGEMAELKVVEIPDDISWEIDEYDGMESVSETHRTWN